MTAYVSGPRPCEPRTITSAFQSAAASLLRLLVATLRTHAAASTVMVLTPALCLLFQQADAIDESQSE